MPSRAELAKIHIAKKELGLDDTAYKGLLSTYNVESSADLNDQQASDLVNRFQQMGWKPKGNGRGKLKFEQLKGRGKGFAKPAQLRKIEVIWRRIARDKSDQALSRFIERQTATTNRKGISKIEWLKDYHAHAVLCALQKMQHDYQQEQPDHEQ